MDGDLRLPTSIFELALQYPTHGNAEAHALAILFDITSGLAPCRVSVELGAKYGEGFGRRCCSCQGDERASGSQSVACDEGLPLDNQQQVVSVTDRVLGGQVWYNEERSKKPQTFMQVMCTHQLHRRMRWQWYCFWISISLIIWACMSGRAPARSD